LSVTEQVFPTARSSLFAVLTDPTTYPRWLVGAKRIREVSSDWPAEGSEFKHVVGFGPLAIPDRTSVMGVAQDEMLELLVRARPVVEATVRFDLELSPLGCLLRMTETPRGMYKVMSPIARPLIDARNRRSLRRLAAVVAASGSVRAAAGSDRAGTSRSAETVAGTGLPRRP
jgi:hypothetical protein